jgi:hypothetical protein
MAAKSPAGVQETYNISPPHLQKLFESLDAEFVKAKYAKSLRMPKTADQKRVFREYLANVKAMYLDPTDSFSESFYLDRNPDVTAAVKADEYHCGFHHWVAYGRDEGRVCRPARTGPPIIENLIEIKQDEQFLFAAIFDDEFYLATYPNIGLTRRDNAFSYFIRIGLRQGHVPVPAASFDESFYLSYYRDVRMAKERGAIPSGYYHYVVAGRAEGRVPVHDVGRLIKLKIGDAAEPVGLSRAHDIAERLVPITIEIDDTRPATLSVFIPTLDPDMMFGGYIAFFHFLCRMIEADYRIRFLIMEDYYSNKDWFMRNVADRPRWAAAFREVEVLNCSQRAEVVPFNSHDVCVAYSTWTMHDAWSVSSRLRKRKVLFFIQEHEDIFHEHGAAQFVVAAAYRLPHFAIFNSDSLEQHFRKHELGVFAERGGGSFCHSPTR